MYFYLAEGKTIKDLIDYGFRDCGDCYRWIRVYTDEVLGVIGQDTMEISQDDGLVTFISRGRNNYKSLLELAKILQERDIIKIWDWNGRAMIKSEG